MRPAGWLRGAAREWPLLLAAAGILSLGVLVLHEAPPGPVPERAAAPGRLEDPLELLRRGAGLLGTDEAFPPLREGLARIRSPRQLDPPAFDFPAFHAALRAAWERETDPDRLARFAEIAGEIRRIFPGEPGHALEPGRLWRRAGRAWDSARQFAAAAEALAADPPAAARARREAAEAYALGGYFRQAAAQYRRLAEDDADDTESLFRCAESLLRAGLRAPGTLAAFDDYVRRVKPGDPLLPRALLRRGALLADLGRREEALREFDRVLNDTGLGIDPRAEEWAEALLRRGRTLMETAILGPESSRRPVLRDARLAFEEYLDRYAASGPIEGPALEAGRSLVRLRMEEGEWKGALERLEDVLSRLKTGESADPGDAILELRFLRGDLLSLLGRHEEAARAYGAAARRHSTEPERLWGYLGRARSLLRLGRKDEARLDCERARAVYESEPGTFDRSLAGRGRDYWRGELDALAREVR